MPARPVSLPLPADAQGALRARLRWLGYRPDEVNVIARHVTTFGSLRGCPALHADDFAAVAAVLPAMEGGAA